MSTAAVARIRLDLAGPAKRYYFPFVLALILALSLVAFWDNLVSDVGQPSNSDPKMIVHGAFALAWVLVLVLQATFVRTGNMRMHRALGTAGFIAAVGVTLSTLYLFVAVWKGWEAMTPQIRANRVLLPSFSLWILLAYLNRGRPVLHKRFVYTGTLFLLEPILARTFDPIVVPLLPSMPESQVDLLFYYYLAITWSAFFLSLLVYDRLVLRRVHPLSAASFVWVLAVYGLVYLI
jgi:hypothetical protein